MSPEKHGFTFDEAANLWRKLVDGPISLVLLPLEGGFTVVIEQEYYGEHALTIKQAHDLQQELSREGKAINDKSFLLTYNAVQMCIVRTDEQLENVIKVVLYE